MIKYFAYVFHDVHDVYIKCSLATVSLCTKFNHNCQKKLLESTKSTKKYTKLKVESLKVQKEEIQNLIHFYILQIWLSTGIINIKHRQRDVLLRNLYNDFLGVHILFKINDVCLLISSIDFYINKSYH